jgi:hypothetical protein
MSAFGPPPYDGRHPAGPPPGMPPPPPGGPYPGSPPQGPYPPAMPGPGYGGPPPRRARSGSPVALIVIIAFAVLLAGGGVYLATISSGRYPKLMYACALLLPSDIATLAPHGLPEGTAPAKGSDESSCTWDNLAAQNAGLEKQDASMNVRVQRYGRNLAVSAEHNAHKWLRYKTGGSAVSLPGTPIAGYGDEAVRVPRAYAGTFDKIVFRDSNLVVEVAAEVDDHPGPQPALAWSRVQQATRIVLQRLRLFRH